MKLQTTGKLDREVYNEEYQRLSNELNGYRETKAEFEKNEERAEQLKKRVYESIDVINSRKELLEEFDKDIFNALIEKIEILEPTHFILKSGMRTKILI